jgi:serine/threonine protein kinase
MTVHARGTPDYIAPELYMPNAKFTPACDIYSLGITGIELITGSRKQGSIKDIWINNDVTQILWK